MRPDDARYGENPNRLQTHTQFQVILKPDPGNPQELYLGSLTALGIDVARPRRPVRRGQLGLPGARRLGPGLGGVAGRPGDHPVHLLPAGRRADARPGVGGDHLRHRAHHDGAAGRRPLQGHRLRARHLLRRGVRPGRVRDEPLLPRRRRRRQRTAAVRGVRGRGRRMLDARLPVPAHVLRAASARTPSTCSTRAARSARPSAPRRFARMRAWPARSPSCGPSAARSSSTRSASPSRPPPAAARRPSFPA